MDPLRARLEQMVAGMPEGSNVSLPVSWIRDQLEAEPSEEADRLADLTVSEVAEEFGRSENAVRDWIRAGELDAYRFQGREYRIPRDAVRQFLERQRSGEESRSHQTAGSRGGGRLDDWRRVNGGGDE